MAGVDAAANPALYKTTNFGESWTTSWTTASLPPSSTVSFNELSRIVCSSTTTCLIFGAFSPTAPNEGFLVTTDGGISWQPFFTSLIPLNGAGFEDLVCASTSTCFFAFGQNSQTTSLIRSQDGGQSWQAVAAPPGSMNGDSLGDLTCPTATICYFHGQSSPPLPSGGIGIDATTDGGVTWTGPSLLRANAAPAGMSCVSASTCYAPFHPSSGDETDGVLATTDGWATSTVEPLPGGVLAGRDQGGAFYGPLLACPDPGVCYDSATADGGTTSKFGYRALLLEGLGDTVAPSVAVAKLPVGVTSSSVRVKWSATDAGSGVASYDVRYERAAFSGGFGPWVAPSSWRAITATSLSLGLAPGYDYCVEVRARDHAGNLSGWAGPRCVARALDDRSLSKGSGWARRTGSGYYLGTFTSTSKKLVVLRRSGAQLDRLGVVATTCSSCGAVALFVGSTLIGKISLATLKMHKQKVLMLPRFTYRTGAVTIKTLTSGKTIEIDGLVVSRT